jgi:DNA gyrase subunit A
LIVELQRGADATEIMADLFKYTPLQDTFSIIMLALVDGQPRTLTLKQALRVYLEHRMEIVRRRSEYDLMRAKERAHILEGLLKALDNLDEVISIIRSSKNADAARDNLMSKIQITAEQAQAILDMQLRRLAALERKKIEDEYKEKVKLIKHLESLLEDPRKMRIVIAEELAVIRQDHGDPRRTIIGSGTAASMSASDFLIPQEPTWVVLSADGKLGRTYNNDQPAVTTKTKNPPRLLMASNTAQVLYLFTSSGESASIPVQQLPQINEVGEGTHFKDLIPLPETAEIVAGLCLPSMDFGYIFFTTAKEQVKRIRMEDLPGVSTKSFIVMNIEEGDRLIAAFVTSGSDQVMLLTASGQAIRFDENDVRPMGLPAGGVRGIKLDENGTDRIVAAFPVDDSAYIWSISNDGVAKISHATEYPVQGRAGQGVINMRLPKDSKEVSAAAIGKQDDNIVVMTSKSKPLYMRIGRAIQLKRGRPGGDFVLSLKDNEQVSGVVSYQPVVTVPEGSMTEVQDISDSEES